MTTSIKPLYVVDTNALYWYLSSDNRLSSAASATFEFASQGETQIVISAIVVAELYYVNKKWGGLENFHETYSELRKRPEFLFVPLKPDEVLDFDVDAAIPEMHDRIIVGLARRLNAPLLTSDQVITDSGLVSIVW